MLLSILEHIPHIKTTMVGPLHLKETMSKYQVISNFNAESLKMALLKTKYSYLSRKNQGHRLQGHHQKSLGHPPHSQYHLREQNFKLESSF